MRDKRIKVVDVEFGFEKCRHEPVQLRGGIDLHGQQLTFGKRKAVIDQQTPRPFGIVHDAADDRAVGGVQHGQREHVHAVRGERVDQIVQTPQAVRREYGELRHGIRLTGRRGLGRHIRPTISHTHRRAHQNSRVLKNLPALADD